MLELCCFLFLSFPQVRLMESQTPLLALKGASASLRAAGPGAALPAARLLFTISKDSAADAAFRR